MQIQGLIFTAASRIQPHGKAKAGNIHKPGADQFVRFGSSQPSDSPQTRNKQYAERVLAAIANAPGSASLAESLDYWRRNEYKDNYLLTYLWQNLEDGVHANRFPPETVLKALNGGLQLAFDEALERNVDYNRPQTLLIAGDSEEYKMFHVGRMGSKRFIPVLKAFIEGPDMDKRHQAHAALSWMANSLDRDKAIEAKKLMAKHEVELAHDMLQNRRANCYAYIGDVARSGSADAARLIGEMWDEFLEKYKKDESRRSETTQHFVRDFAELLASEAPGAQAAVDARKSELLKYLDGKINQEWDQFDYDTRERHQLLKAALFGTDLSELPPRKKPAELASDPKRYWVYEDDQQYFNDFPLALEAMAARGVPGAATRLMQVEVEREDFMIGEFEKFLIGNLVTYTDRDSGALVTVNNFENYFFNRQLMPMATRFGTPRLIPMLERVLSEPWMPMDRNEWWSSGADYTTDRTEGTKRRLVPVIQGLIDDIKLRHGLL